MSRINAIQQAIDTLNGGEFQKMMDEYFSKRFSVYSTGSTFGDNNPKKGTPDALIRLNNNRYIFMEYTVQRYNIIDKILDDIDSCLDEDKTNIAKSQIEKIICCTKITLKTKDIKKIYEKAEKENVELELLTGDVISQQLLRYPTVVKNHLNLEMDTGQILDVEDFVRLYNSGRLATPLDTRLYGREDDVDKVITSIESGYITVLSGAPGIGKTRLALDCIEKYNRRHPEYVVRCFRYNGMNFYEDLELLFEKGNKYLLFIDDANQLTQLDLILDSLNRSDIELKLILTVREYAKEKLLEKLGFLNARDIEISLLEEDVIKKICYEEYGVKNQHAIDQIVEIAKGNSRLAIMAAQIAITESKLSSLANPGDLLEVYFKSVKSDFENELNSRHLLRIAAIIGFLGSLNLKDKKNITTILNIFKVDEESLRVGVETLHNMEIVDVYNNDVVKVSDQILNTFIFYHTVFEKEYLKYSDFIKGYFPQIKHRIIEHLNGIMFYYHEKIYEQVVEEINEVYKDVKESGSSYEAFIQTFWFALGVDPLIYATEKIEEMDTETGENIDYDVSKSSMRSSELIDLLGNFSNTPNYREALELTFNYLVKKPSQFKVVYESLIRAYRYDKNSSLSNFTKQRHFFQVIVELYLESDNYTKQMMLLRISQYFLKFDYDYTEAGRSKKFTLYSFTIERNNNVDKIRQLAWRVLKFNRSNLLIKEEVNKALTEYGNQSSNSEDIDTIISFDKKHILELLKEVDKIDLSTSIAFGKVNELLIRYNLEFEEEAKGMYETNQFKLLNVMSESDFTFNSLQEAQSYRKEELKKLIDFKSLSDYEQIFELTRDVIKNELVNDKYAYFNSLSQVLESAHFSIMKRVLKCFFTYNFEVRLNPLPILNSYSNYYSLKELKKVIVDNEFFNQDHWLYSIFYLEANDNINFGTLEKIYDLFEKSNLKWFGRLDIELFTRFKTVDPEVFINITKLVLNKDDNLVLGALQGLFNPNIFTATDLMTLFSSDLSVLKELYLKLYKFDQHLDYTGEYLKSILQADIYFLDELFDRLVSKKIFIYGDDDPFSVLWEMDEWEIYIDHYFNILLDYEKTAYIANYIQSFFNKKRNNRAEKILDRQIQWIEQTISKYYNNEKEIKVLFKAIVNLDENSRIKAIKLFVEKNTSYDLFSKLQFEPTFFSWSGSEIPLLKRRRDFFTKLDKELVGIHYLKHKEYLQKVIDLYNKRIEEVTVEEFMEDI